MFCIYLVREILYLPVYNVRPCIIRTLILTTSFYKNKRIHNKDHLLTLHFFLFNQLELGIYRSRQLQLFLITVCNERTEHTLKDLLTICST